MIRDKGNQICRFSNRLIEKENVAIISKDLSARTPFSIVQAVTHAILKKAVRLCYRRIECRMDASRQPRWGMPDVWRARWLQDELICTTSVQLMVRRSIRGRYLAWFSASGLTVQVHGVMGKGAFAPAQPMFSIPFPADSFLEHCCGGNARRGAVVEIERIQE
jgi:hypothetical protein